MVYKFFDKKIAGGAVQNKNVSNGQLAEELHKLIIRKFKKVYSSLKDNIWGANLVDRQQLISKFNKGIRFLLCAIDVFSRYAWFVLLKNKTSIIITNDFEIILDKSGRKPNKFWVDKESEFYSRLMKSQLQDNDIAMYLTTLLLLKDL